MKSRGTSFVFKKLSVQEDKVQLMKGLICNRPAPGLIRIKERSSEVCEFQRPRHLFFFCVFFRFQLHIASTSWDLFSQLGNLPLHLRLWASSVEGYKNNNLEVQVRQMALACFSGGDLEESIYTITLKASEKSSIPCMHCILHCMYLLDGFRLGFLPFEQSIERSFWIRVQSVETG